MPANQAHDDAIREKAYYLWEEDGKPHGRDQEYWQRAMVALSSKAKMDTLPKAAPKKPKAEAKPIPVKAKLKAAASKTKSAPTKAAPAKKPKKK